jgi:hypothetical protein
MLRGVFTSLCWLRLRPVKRHRSSQDSPMADTRQPSGASGTGQSSAEVAQQHTRSNSEDSSQVEITSPER